MSRVRRAEIVEDVDWLLKQGVHPLMVIQALGRTASSIEGLARKEARQDIASLFTVYTKQEAARNKRAA